ncbi:MAG: DUF1499 domain-containing protein, partial [Pseudohongiellaceae bacterium]
VLPLRAAAPNSVVYGDSPNMTPERNAQLQREAYPDLVPKEYAVAPDAMFQRALAAVDAMGWELVAANAAEGRIEATATTFWLRFKDDVVIRIRPGGNGPDSSVVRAVAMSVPMQSACGASSNCSEAGWRRFISPFEVIRSTGH